MGFSRQEYWSGLSFPSPGDLPDPGIEPRSPALQADALTSEPPGRELQIKIWKYHYTLQRSNSKILKTSKADEEVEHQELSVYANGNRKCYNYFGRQFEVSYKTKHILHI